MVNLDRINALPGEEARREFAKCCGSTSWARRMADHRPFGTEEELMNTAGRIWWELGEKDWKEAFSHHPMIGDVSELRKRFAGTADLSESEQSGEDGADDATLEALAKGNRDYAKRFGFIFIVCATGKSAREMLELLRERIGNAPEREIRIAAEEQEKITRIRLARVFAVREAE